MKNVATVILMRKQYRHSIYNREYMSSHQREEGATAETFDDGKHYYVLFTFNGVTKAVEPEQARLYAEDLLRAADEAEAAQGTS